MESEEDGHIAIVEKRQLESCIICSKRAPVTKLTTPRDSNSWLTLLNAAEIQNFAAITKFAKYEKGSVPPIHYHRSCRSSFTLKKTLESIQEKGHGIPNNDCDQVRRKSARVPEASTSRVYEEECIFCQKSSKYARGTNSREALTKCIDLRSDKTIRDIVHKKMDERIMALLSRDIVAAEAHYHKSCYRAYTRDKAFTKESSPEDTDQYTNAEHEAYEMLFSYVRRDLFGSPCVIRMTDLTCKLTQFMKSLWFEEIKDHIKKHIRRRLESEFGDSLCIINDNGRLLVMPDSLTREELAKQNIALTEKLNILEKSEKDVEKLLERAAIHLRDEIKGCSAIEQKWPPYPAELDQEYLPLPDNLIKFFTDLLSGPRNQSSNRTQRLARSFAQDSVYGVSAGKQKSSKHILLPWVIKTLTGNIEVIKGLNRLGHGISYSQLVEIDTALALQKLETDQGIALPSNIQPGVPTTVAYDNIDRLEETLSGGGTSHRVNGIAVQPRIFTAQPKPVLVLTAKDKKRSIDPANILLAPYNAGERVEPPVIETINVDTGNAAEEAKLKNVVWSLVRQVDIQNQKISSWTGHNIQTRDQVHVTQDNIGYLPTINAPATQMSTIFEILSQVSKIMELLHIPNIVCVFDQAIYEKAIEVSWKHAEKFKDIIFRMGVFHACCNLMGTIGKRFKDAGLRDMAVESGIVAEGSVESVMSGKRYNRAVRFHKLMYEALLRLAWRGFYVWLEKNDVTHLPLLHDTIKLIEELHADVSQKALQSILQHPACQYILQQFEVYLGHMRNSNGSLSKFWMSYLDMVDILLGLIRASREGNWKMHMAFIRRMIPWCFAYDKRNYAKYLSVYYGQMTRLPLEHPDVYENFLNGGFSVQIGEKNPFGRIPVDQTIEETVNKDTQTAGGTKGFSLKPGAISKYYLTAEHRSASMKHFREMINVSSPAFVHPDLQPSRIKKDEADVQSLVNLMGDTWTNPFDNNPTDLISISTGKMASPEVTNDILNAFEIGENAYSDFKRKRIGVTKSVKFHDRLPNQNLKTFGNLTQQKMSRKANRETVLKADNKLFGRMVLIASSRKLNMKNVLKYPLGPLPWALTNSDGTLKKTDKATLARHLENKARAAEEIPQPSACLIDGMSLVQKTNGEQKTFGEISEHIFHSVLNTSGNSKRVDVVFDVYKETSIKNAERISRGSGVLFTNVSRGHKIRQWRKLLACSVSKTSLIKFLYTDWQNQRLRDKLGEKEVYVTCEHRCIRITKDYCEEVPALDSSQEEADTRLFLHAKHAEPNFESVVIVADDTDVLILCLAFSNDISCNIFMKCGTQNRTRYINMTKLAQILGKNVCKALIGLHAFTGCDSVSAFAGKGKVSGLKLLEDHTFQKMFAEVGKEWTLTDEVLRKLQEFTCRLYATRSSTTSVNDLRYQLFRAKKGNIESGQLPPCEDCLKLHVQRANYQSAIWRRSLEAFPDTPSPDGHGWIVHPDGNLTIKWMNVEPAPDVILEFLSCNCSRVCKLPKCECIINGMSCTDSCRLSMCDNMKEEEDITFDSSDDDCEEEEEEEN